MSGRIVFLDTETTGLDPTTERVFEIAVITGPNGGPDDCVEWTYRLRPERGVVLGMHPEAVKVNRYHHRVADPGWVWDDPFAALVELYGHLDEAHIVGAVPDFDTRFLTETYRRFNLHPPRWHYHLIDIEALAVGFLAGIDPPFIVDLPWESDVLSRAVGVEPPGPDERHTALGDARWCKRVYEAVMGL